MSSKGSARGGASGPASSAPDNNVQAKRDGQYILEAAFASAGGDSKKFALQNADWFALIEAPSGADITVQFDSTLAVSWPGVGTGLEFSYDTVTVGSDTAGTVSVMLGRGCPMPQLAAVPT